MSADHINSNSYGNLDEQISQLMRFKPLSELEVKLKNMSHTARIKCLAWSPDNLLVATGSLDT